MRGFTFELRRLNIIVPYIFLAVAFGSILFFFFVVIVVVHFLICCTFLVYRKMPSKIIILHHVGRTVQ